MLLWCLLLCSGYLFVLTCCVVWLYLVVLRVIELVCGIGFAGGFGLLGLIVLFVSCCCVVFNCRLIVSDLVAYWYYVVVCDY